ncbi:hypothetical protein HPP92_015840 [Vanilla planifolia]|uniref:Uncharacterized protein n=1 Tax=Vanilla planifolia TaxID=51239 RepID=A0A835UPX6_VANPL|nr:hypothetical protein HPP92_027240 [Vanilla planifolia]KAG0471294.1 hypothetical protein HPP92_015840 [Vanilla planifolia]
MGKREIEGRCKIHSTHKQSKGVCPHCLRERLAKLTVNTSSSAAPSTADSSVSPVASSASTSSTHEHRSKSKLLRLLLGKKTVALRRSSSLAFTLGEPERPRKEKKKKKKVEKKEGGSYWFRFIRAGEGRKKEGERGLSHSITMKEQPSSK